MIKISFGRFKQDILAVIPYSQIKKWGAVHPYFVPIYGRFVYFRRLRQSLSLINRYSKNKKDIADIGCGLGTLVKLLQEKYPTSKIIGLDLRDKKQLDYASKICSGKSQFIQGNVEDLPFKQNSFDVIVITDVLEHVSKPIKALNELKRTLRKAGILLILVPTESPLLKFMRAILYYGKLESDYHWTHAIKTVNQFEVELRKKFKIIKKTHAPFGFGGNLLNYDAVYVCKK